jgi:hypothetical protein
MQQRAGTSNAFADLAAQTLGYVKASGDAVENRMILDNCGCLFDRLPLSASVLLNYTEKEEETL